MRRSRIIQKFETTCARWVDKCPFLVLLALGIFTLAANLTANTIWEAAEAGGTVWKWATYRIWLYVLPFLVTLFFLYFIARPLFTINTIHREAEVRRHLILFLSFLRGDNQVQQKLAKTCGINPELLKRLTFDSLYLDLEEMLVWKNQGNPFWSWEMPLRAICWHRPGQTLKSVSLVCSDKSITQVQWFLEICSRYPETKNLDFYIVDRHQGLPRHIGASTATPLRTDEGWDFEDFDALKYCLQDHLHELNRLGLADTDIMIDFTGGQKVTSVVATTMTLNRPLKAQYIQTNAPYEALEYDLFLVFADRGKVGV